jgi:hypothetical protein
MSIEFPQGYEYLYYLFYIGLGLLFLAVIYLLRFKKHVHTASNEHKPTNECQHKRMVNLGSFANCVYHSKVIKYVKYNAKNSKKSTKDFTDHPSNSTTGEKDVSTPTEQNHEGY